MSKKISVGGLILAAIAIAFVYADVAKVQGAITDGLISHWSFDKSTIQGRVVKDVWGNNDGRIIGDPRVVPGKIGEALRFDGHDDHIHIPNDASLKPLGAFTISAWVKANSLDNMWIVSKTEHHNSGYDLMIFDSKPWFSVHAPGAQYGLPSSVGISAGRWYHIVGVYLAPASGIYVNGEFKEMNALAMLKTGNKNLIIGYSEDPKGQAYFDGCVDEVSIYKRALSEDEIKQIFAAKSSLFAVEPADKLTGTWGKTKVSR